MGIADAAARSGLRTLLIDADVYGGVLASAFGLLDESAGLAGACRLATNGRLDQAEMARLCWKITPWLTLLTGIARADRWPELRPSAIPAVIGLARERADVVVVDCAAVLESDEEITFDTLAPRRNGATLATLDQADEVLAVGSADPPGMERLMRGLTEIGEALPGRTPTVVVNRVRASAATAGGAVEAVRRFADTEPAAMLPEDRRGCDAAWRRGVVLSEAAPASPLLRPLRELTADLVAAPGRRRAPSP
jgi:Flp pilus assembly CpaE family ATPase